MDIEMDRVLSYLICRTACLLAGYEEEMGHQKTCSWEWIRLYSILCKHRDREGGGE
jgi:hypothetical protein